MQAIFCPQCHDLILDLPACSACGWQRPLTSDDAGKLVWQGDLGHRLAKPRCYSVVAGGGYCATTEDGAVVALDLATGQKLWEHALGAGCATHALATDGVRLFVGCTDTRPIPSPGKAFLALEARTGEIAWEYSTSAHSYSAAAVSEDTIVFVSSEGLLYAVEAASGRRCWQRAHPHWGPEAPTVGAGVICAGGRAETLVAYSASDGAELWRFAAEGWFAGELTIAEGRVFALCWDGYLYVLDAQSGQLLWKARGERDKGFTSPPAIAGGRLFIGSRVYDASDEQQKPTYAMLALDAADGAELWRFYTGRHIFAPPAAADDTVLFGTDDGSFYTLDAASGAERWQARIDGRIVAQPQVDGDMAFVGERSGTIYAFRWRAGTTEQLLAPEAHLERGEHELAAVAYALHGHLEASAALYEQRLGRPREAALLYERAGQPGKAALLWEQLGELRHARDRYADAGDSGGLARTLAQLGEPRQAAHLYEQIGSFEAAAQLYEESGDRIKAAELYDQSGQYSRARAIWESLGRWERQVDDLLREGQPTEAATVLEQHGQLERAAELYEAAGQLLQALDLRVRLEHWERVTALAATVGDDEQAAVAHEQLHQQQPAAAAYERAAQQAAAKADEERAAALYERAARLYAEIYDEERAAACRREVLRYHHLPEVVISGEADAPFVEYEWNVLTLRVENAGYGPARAITVALRGAFDVEGDLQIAVLPPQRSAALEISLRPHREHYGPKVPLEIVLQYEDARGNRYEAMRRHRVHVVRQGAEHSAITPPELRVGDQGAPGLPASPGPEGTQRAPDQEEIDQQIEQLAVYRRRLAYHLHQEATLGNTAPFSLVEEIRIARERIRSIKQTLRGWNAAVDDSPNDDPSMSAPPVPQATVDKRALRETIVQAFNLDELELLCADVEQDLRMGGITLPVSLELVDGSGKPGKVLNLINYLDRRGYLAYLVSAVRRSRPGII
jgi:outer membrane protein assembly factor BamB/tetratricopeptide (TPR) repeat protein